MPMELMSPAGSLEGVIAAVRGGADAVYFGTGDFNARRNAKNLEGDDLAEALRYCRLRGVRTYVTVNTLVTDRELSRAREMILQLNQLGADALIVQDWGVAAAVKALAPSMPLHASTQMAIHSPAGVKTAEQLGFAASLGVEGKPCCLTRDPACLIRIPRYTRTSQKTAEELLCHFWD